MRVEIITTTGGVSVQFQLLFPSSWHRVQGELWDPALVIALPGKRTEMEQRVVGLKCATR